MATNFTDYENLLKPGCPWVDLREAGGLPNVKWCEETLCAWVAEPANTWSNLAYVAAAVVLYLVARKEPERTLRFWAPAAFIVGTSSLVYHASVTFVTQVLDFWGMYFYFLLILCLNLVRMGALKKEALFKTLWPAIFGFTALTVAVAKAGVPVQGLILALIVLTLVTEIAASRRAQGPVSHRMFAVTLVLIIIAASFSAADASRAWCTPADHVFQGHAIWHCFGALALTASYFHFRQFRAQFV